MARLFRIWEKKRGDRRTGSRLVGSAGEALFYAALILVGAVALAELLCSPFIRAEETVLSRGGWTLWLMLLALVSLVVIGARGVIYTVLQAGASAERRSALTLRASHLNLLGDGSTASRGSPNVPDDGNQTNSPGTTLAYRLPIAATAGWRLLAAAVICLIWNGVVALLVVLVVNGHVAGRPDWRLTWFVVPFAGIGVWTLYYFVRQLLVATGIGPTSIEVSDLPLYPGASYRVFLTQAGRRSMRWLEMALVCDEEATYRQGTDARTESRRVFQHRLFRRENFDIRPGKPCEQQCRLDVPLDVMHSFQAEHNAIRWKLVVKGEASRWPSYERTFPVVVYPDQNGEPAA